MLQQSDEELIRQTLAGNQRSFAELVQRYQRRVAITIRSVIGDLPQDELADIAQDIFLLVFKALKSFRGESQFGTYLTRIALRHCYREAKRRKKRRFIFSSYDVGDAEKESLADRQEGGGKTDRALIAGERQSAVIDALQGLPEEFRTVLVLRIVEELSVEEVAESLSISTGTVKSRLHRAKEKMRDLLEGIDPELQFEVGEI